MKVEIWSDVMCPFCYIGKRKFENALKQFPEKDNIQVEWKSFQLSPDLITDPSKNINQYLMERKGWSYDQAKQANDHVTKMAAEVGLSYHFDKAIVANSFDAHRFSHFAAKHGKGDAAEEALFKAYFTDGKNTADHATLIQLGIDIGLNGNDVKAMLESNEYADEVNRDIYEASQLGARGVPFFVMNRQYAVSGAQPTETFLEALNESYDEWKKTSGKNLVNTEGQVCTPDDECK
jgi:predicted DsbA family dithiol-disulfide isomerase